MDQQEVILDIGYEEPFKPLILVVDDETSLQTLIFDTLEDDYRIIIAHNGREGVEKAVHAKPAVILMDVMMPDIGGYEAARLLQEHPETKNIPIIIMTAQDFDSSTIQLIRLEPNVSSFLTKPFRPKALRELLRKTIESKGK